MPRRLGQLGQQSDVDDSGTDRFGTARGTDSVNRFDSKPLKLDSVEVEDTRSSNEDDGSTNIYHNHEVFHDEPIFLKTYKEMNTSLKIYIYPHNSHEPFANVLLPVKQEPGGNYASEMYFKNTLFKSHFITTDPSTADFFFLPFSIASMRHDKRIGVGRLANFVKDYVDNAIHQYPYWNRTGGSDHFYVACHSIGRVALSKADIVKSNAIQVICSSSYFLPNYFSHKDVALPQVWPRHEKLDLTATKRKKLAFFAGAMNSPVRKILYTVWKGDPDIFVYDGRLPTPYSKQLLGSKYCLHVKGFEVNTARLGDAMYYGCVPVIIADHYDLPYMDILNWESFSVVVKVDDIPKLKKILQGISAEEFGRLQNNVMKARKHFQWNMVPTDYDAFYMVMFELWLRRGSVRLSF